MRGKWAEDAHGADAGAARHLDIFRGVADVDALARPEPELSQGFAERRRMRLAPRSIFTAHARGENPGQSETAKLAGDALAVAARDNAEDELPSKLPQDAARAEEQLWAQPSVRAAPESVGLFPALPRNSRRAIDAVPIGRIVPLQIRETPVHPERAKHLQIGARIRVVGIQQRPIPIEEHCVD